MWWNNKQFIAEATLNALFLRLDSKAHAAVCDVDHFRNVIYYCSQFVSSWEYEDQHLSRLWFEF